MKPFANAFTEFKNLMKSDKVRRKHVRQSPLLFELRNKTNNLKGDYSMKKKLTIFLAILFVMFAFMTTPNTASAHLFPFPDGIGPNEFGMILDKFMIKSTFRLPAGYTIESKSNSGNITTYVIQQASKDKISEGLEVKVNNNNVIVGVTFRLYNPQGFNVDRMYSAYSLIVNQRYGNSTEEGKNKYGHPYSAFSQDGAYKYRLDVQKIGLDSTLSLGMGTGFIKFTVDAL